ncbi:hypothetical protein BJ508DRAFT_375230 [Ascobolus immersus RN42]|uniref:Uncharacterized protein n=1 Tax=Ascobolus immersus RN42 TaxID=1160509 RepID=A0A3N4IAZ4_ASCIM|nr:hypothetical protein BJ508DRAFT_375230 [Ascobolus immersus RN42]
MNHLLLGARRSLSTLSVRPAATLWRCQTWSKAMSTTIKGGLAGSGGSDGIRNGLGKGDSSETVPAPKPRSPSLSRKKASANRTPHTPSPSKPKPTTPPQPSNKASPNPKAKQQAATATDKASPDTKQQGSGQGSNKSPKHNGPKQQPQKKKRKGLTEEERELRKEKKRDKLLEGILAYERAVYQYQVFPEDRVRYHYTIGCHCMHCGISERTFALNSKAVCRVHPPQTSSSDKCPSCGENPATTIGCQERPASDHHFKFPRPEPVPNQVYVATENGLDVRSVVLLACEEVELAFGKRAVAQLKLVDLLSNETLIDSYIAIPKNERVTDWWGLSEKSITKAVEEAKAFDEIEAARQRLVRYVDPNTVIVSDADQDDLKALRIWHDPSKTVFFETNSKSKDRHGYSFVLRGAGMAELGRRVRTHFGRSHDDDQIFSDAAPLFAIWERYFLHVTGSRETRLPEYKEKRRRRNLPFGERDELEFCTPENYPTWFLEDENKDSGCWTEEDQEAWDRGEFLREEMDKLSADGVEFNISPPWAALRRKYTTK